MPRALMIQGTASHVGKSVLTAAFGRWLLDQGLRVAPFKAQNMSLNSYVTLTGEEIARSQATQAEALEIEPSADMNPVLLKPMQRGCQVVVGGRGVGIMSIHEYYAYKPHAWKAITAAYDRLAPQYDAIVLEGAGSPAEINLKEQDLVNMRMADHADAAVVLVADIERGGVFAQLIGTWELLEPHERSRIVGFVINKFRGEPSLLDSGLEFVHKRTGRPVLGVLPFEESVQLDEEDSLGVSREPTVGEIDIAIIRLPGLSNFTDFAALSRAPGVGLRYVAETGQLGRPDLVILPGTRTTIVALNWLRASGLADALARLNADTQGPHILGVCGGCQILGRSIRDPGHVESDVATVQALGLLSIETTFAPTKILRRVEGRVVGPASLGEACPVVGYEVHQGSSNRDADVSAWLRLKLPDGTILDDGAISSNRRVCGTYVHGLFDDARFCRSLITFLRERRGLQPLAEQQWLSQKQFWAARYRQLGGWLREHCDLRPIAAALQLS